jgi:hypothetical protein
MWPYTEDELVFINQACQWQPMTDEDVEWVNNPTKMPTKG